MSKRFTTVNVKEIYINVKESQPKTAQDVITEGVKEKRRLTMTLNRDLHFLCFLKKKFQKKRLFRRVFGGGPSF